MRMRKTPRKPQDSRPTRDRACIARRPANLQSSSPAHLPLRSTPSSELSLRLFQRHEVCDITLHNALHCIAFAVTSTLVATKSVPSREFALILFQLAFASTLVAMQREATVDSYSIFAFLHIAPSHELVLCFNFAPAP